MKLHPCAILHSASMLVLVGVLLNFLEAAANAQYQPPTNGLVAWWGGDGNGNDSVGGHNGVPGTYVRFVPGVSGQAFEFYNPSSGGSRVNIPDDPAFKLTNSLSIGAWIRTTSPSWTIFVRGDDRSGLDPYALSSDPDTSRLMFEVTDAQGGTMHLYTAGPCPTNEWVQFTGTLDGATGDMRIYVNGVLVGETNTTVRPFGDLLANMNPGLCIGNTPTYNFPFVGDIDEVVLYARALTPQEAAGLATVFGPPTITQSPSDALGYLGGSVEFDAAASGNPLPALLWFKDGAPISWATNATLVLHHLAATDSGNYRLQASNSFGTVTSGSAALYVNPVGVGIGMHPFLTVTGVVGKTYGIEYSTVMSFSNAWFNLTNLTLTQPVEEWIDASVDAARDPQRYYRVVVLPDPQISSH